MKKMISYSEGNLHDINHFIKVWTYAKTIGELEHLDKDTQLVLEIAAILHDIACPVLRERIGNADGRLQEIEGVPLANDFLEDFEVTKEQLARILFLIGHHHNTREIDGIDYQILIEADYIVNAEENQYSSGSIANVRNNIFKTKSGMYLLDEIFC